MSLDRRLRRLEVLSGSFACSECGHAEGVPVDYELDWDDPEEGEDPSPEFCPECGRQTMFVIGWDDPEEAGRRSRQRGMPPPGAPGGGGR